MRWYGTRVSSYFTPKKKKRETKENKTLTGGRRKPLHKSFTWSLCCLGSVQVKGFGLGKFGFVGLVQAWVRGFVALCFCFWPLWVFVVFVLISCFVWFLLWSLVYVCVFVIFFIVCENSWNFFFFFSKGRTRRDQKKKKRLMFFDFLIFFCGTQVLETRVPRGFS